MSENREDAKDFTKPTGRVESLDALRGLAALAVLFCHLLPAWRNGASGYSFWAGAYGVEIFFMISGFVILKSLERNSIKSFLLSRFLRLFPTFWFCVGLTTALLICLESSRVPTLSQFVANLTMIPKQFLGIDSYIDGSYWTLEYELYFYLFAAVFFYSLGREALVFSLFLLVLANVFITSLELIPMVGKLPRPIASVSMRLYGILFIEHSHLFLMGVMCSCYRVYPRGLFLAICGLCLFAGVLNNRHQEISWGVNAISLGLGFLVFVVLSIHNPVFTRKNRVLKWMGFISYPLYLIHQAIGIELCELLVSGQGFQLIRFVIVVLSLVGLADVIARFVEPQLRKVFGKRYEA